MKFPSRFGCQAAESPEYYLALTAPPYGVVAVILTRCMNRQNMSPHTRAYKSKKGNICVTDVNGGDK